MAYINNTERSQIKDLMLYLKLLEKQEQANSTSRRKGKMIKISAEINELETKRTIQRLKEAKSWFFEKLIRLTTPWQL
jgi:hypothetical protein